MLKIVRNILLVIALLTFLDLVVVDHTVMKSVLFGGKVLTSQPLSNEQKSFLWKIDRWTTFDFGRLFIQLAIDGDNTKEDSDLGQYDFRIDVKITKTSGSTGSPEKSLLIASRGGKVESNREQPSGRITGTEFWYFLGDVEVSLLSDVEVSCTLSSEDERFLSKHPRLIVYPYYNDVFYGDGLGWMLKAFFLFLPCLIVLGVVSVKVRKSERKKAA